MILEKKNENIKEKRKEIRREVDRKNYFGKVKKGKVRELEREV